MTTEDSILIADYMNFKKTIVRNENGRPYDYILPEEFVLINDQEIQVESSWGWGLVKQDFVHSVELVFHSDWNWLMLVVEKIESVERNKEDETHFQLVSFIHHWMTRKHKDLTKIEATFEAVVDFIKWYNENK